MKSTLLILISALVFTSCGELTGNSTGANDNFLNKFVGGLSFIEVGEGKAILNGSMNASDAHSFKLSLKLTEGESVRFFFFSDRGLMGGLIATFSRSAGKTSVNFTLNGESDSRILEGVGEEVNVVLDMHNDHEDAHFMLWNGAGPFGDSEECVEDGSCLYNSEFYSFPNDGPWGSQGKAPGTFWGFQGDSSLILQLEGPLKAVSDA
jgi:hypothetical protein